MSASEAKYQPVDIQTELSRDLGIVSALAIGVGTMIAAGIFTLSGLAIRNVGSAAIISFLLAAVVATFTALTYCEFSSIYPHSGEGYLYARRTFSAPFAYFVGWALFLGYTSSCAFYLVSFSSYFFEFIVETKLESISGLVALAILTLLNIKGTKESGSFQVIVTVSKVILLGWFIVGGLSKVNTQELMERLDTNVVDIASTAAMVFITFFGFSAIAASAGEFKNPTKTIPRAIFIAMGFVTVLYTLVVIVVASSKLTTFTEAAMGEAAKIFLGPIGGLVIVGGALFSMISASNASIMAGSRVTLSMGRLGHLPEGVGQVSRRTRTPIVALLLVGGMIAVFMLLLRLEELAHFADTVLLLALILVNMALIAHRRKYPDLKRPFRVPLVPLLPILGIIANLYLLVQIVPHFYSFSLAVGALILGVLGFFAWKGSQGPEEEIPGLPSRVAVERKTAGEGGFRILVPLHNPANVEPLIELAAAIAKDRDGEIVALRVALVPEQLPPALEERIVERERDMLELAHRVAGNHGVPTRSLIRVGHNAARAILETASERNADLILLGWKGYTKTAKRVFGEVVDDIVSRAKCDIMLVKLVGNEPIRKILLPTAGGEHARCAEGYAASLAKQPGGSLTVATVVSPQANEAAGQITADTLAKARERLSVYSDLDFTTTTLTGKSIQGAILKEAEGYDAIVVGAASQSVYRNILFGKIPEHLAGRSQLPVIVVKHYHPVKALLGKVMSE